MKRAATIDVDDVTHVINTMTRLGITPAHLHWQPQGRPPLGVWVSTRTDFQALTSALGLEWRVRENNTQDPVYGERHYLTKPSPAGHHPIVVQAISRADADDWDAPDVAPEPDLFGEVTA